MYLVHPVHTIIRKGQARTIKPARASRARRVKTVHTQARLERLDLAVEGA